MTAYLGYHHGLLQGALLAGIAALVIAIGLITGRWWVARSESVHILRDENIDDDPGTDSTGRQGGERGQSPRA